MKLPRYIINPFTMAVTYLVIGSLWIVYSDNLVATLIKNPELIIRYQTVKGIFFVILSAVLFYVLANVSESALLNVRKNLYREELKLKRLAETTPMGIIFIEPGGYIRYANIIAERLFELSGEELHSTKFDDLDLNLRTYKGEELPKDENSINVALHTKKGVWGVKYRMGKEGFYKYISVNASPIFVENDELEGVLCTITDITDVIKSENIIQEHEERYNLLVDETPFAVIIHQNNVIQYINPIGLTMLEGQSDSEIVGLSILDVIHPDYIASTLVREMKVKNGEEVHYPFELKVKTLKGNVIPVEIISIPFTIGNTISVQVIAIDISERLEKDRLLAENLNEKNVMLSEIHHRVKNNMAIISGLIQLEAFEVEDERLQAVLFDSVARIKSIALIHEQAYKSNNMAIVRLDNNIEQMVQNIAVNYPPQISLNVEYELEPIVLNINQAVSCALFINEVITSLYKYTTQDEGRGKCVVYCSHKNDLVILKLKILGEQSFKENFESDKTKLNTQLIQLMAQQVHGNLKIEDDNNELLIELRFNKSMKVKGSSQRNTF